MALRLRTNGAPLSGALFVSNPRRRKKAATKRRRRKTSTLRSKARRPRRRKAKKRNASALRRRAAIKAAATRKRNAARRSLAARKAAATRKRNARRNSLAIRLNRRKRNGTKKGMVRKTASRAFAKTNRSRRRRRNPVHTKVRRYTKRRNSAISSLQNKLFNPLKRVVGKIPVVGTTAQKFVAPIALGAAAAAVHYYGVKVLQHVAPGVMQKVSPIKFSLAGSVVATVLFAGGKIPGLKKISAETRNQVASAALVLGGGLDAYRALSNTMGDLGAEVALYDYSGIGMDLSGIGVDLGDGGAYDVVPLPQNMDYSGASMSDAMMAPADLSVEEGEAALAGPAHWHARFGSAPIVHTRHGAFSPLVGRAGHRFGWLIQLVGFPRFRQIAALPPGQRVALIAELKQQAVTLADSKITAGSMSGIGLDMGATLTAGAVV